MILYPHQQKLVDLNPAKHLLAFDRGTGKTLTSIALGNKNCLSVLVVCPKLNKKMWEREVATHGTVNYTVITKEEFKRDCALLPAYDGVIVDEAHYFAGETSQMSKRMHWYLSRRNIKYVWLCTATPYLSTPMNIYVLARLLGKEIDYMSFKHEYFFKVKMGSMKMKNGKIVDRHVWKVKPFIEDRLAKLVAEIGTTVDMEEAVQMAQESPVEGLPELKDVPEQSFETEYFDMTDAQKEAVATLDEPTFINRWTKKHCIENGVLYSDGYSEDRFFDCLKTDRIMKLVACNAKVAIFCRYNAQVAHLERLIAATGRQTFVLNGDTRDKDGVVRAADVAESCAIIIQSQCSAGYELPSIPCIIFASLSFSYVDYIQAVGRFLRINKMKENKYYHLVTNGVDRDIFDCIMRKQDFSLEIYGKGV